MNSSFYLGMFNFPKHLEIKMKDKIVKFSKPFYTLSWECNSISNINSRELFYDPGSKEGCITETNHTGKEKVIQCINISDMLTDFFNNIPPGRRILQYVQYTMCNMNLTLEERNNILQNSNELIPGFLDWEVSLPYCTEDTQGVETFVLELECEL